MGSERASSSCDAVVATPPAQVDYAKLYAATPAQLDARDDERHAREIEAAQLREKLEARADSLSRERGRGTARS